MAEVTSNLPPQVKVFMVHNGQGGQALVITRRTLQGPSMKAQKPPILQDPQEDPLLPPHNHLYAPLSPILQPLHQVQPFTTATHSTIPSVPIPPASLPDPLSSPLPHLPRTSLWSP